MRKMIDDLQAIIEDVRSEFVADPRLVVFDVHVRALGGRIELFGGLSIPDAGAAIRERIASLGLSQSIVDNIAHVSESGVTDRPDAVVTAAIAPMLAGPLVSESHISQVTFGNRVLVLRELGRWLQCRSGDGYIGWIHRGYLLRLPGGDERRPIPEGPAESHFSLGARVVGDDGRTIVQLPWGARIDLVADRAILPNGETGKISGDLVPVAALPDRFPRDGRSVVSTAMGWRGAPYLWGGTTVSGVDCSGLTQSVFAAHGINLPRDSDQQAGLGFPLPTSDPGALAPGDLLFFEERAGRISHVAICTGRFGIIHSSVSNGGVAVNDISTDGTYEAELRSLLVCARRIIPEEA